MSLYIKSLETLCMEDVQVYVNVEDCESEINPDYEENKDYESEIDPDYEDDDNDEGDLSHDVSVD